MTMMMMMMTGLKSFDIPDSNSKRVVVSASADASSSTWRTSSSTQDTDTRS